MYYSSYSQAEFENLLKNPLVLSDKTYAPLWIWGRMNETVEMDPTDRLPRCTGDNIDTISCLQLDFDDGTMSIKQFEDTYKDYSYILYTSYSYGFKNPGTDRFRVILPLKAPLPVKYLGLSDLKDELLEAFPGVDTTCFDRGHWQCVPVVRDKKAPYYSNIHKGVHWGPDKWEWEEQFADHEQVMEMYKVRLQQRRQALVDSAEDFLIVPPNINSEALINKAQEIIDGTEEGARDTTLFKVLNYLHDHGCDAADAYSLNVWEGFEKVLEDKIGRIWYV